eukprot:TRINITY_DN6699_c0_g1_i3.p1 TRINITY_DN6699_c0_g1~~TRINITY_DN6699_c0_g1_i3.p1  ORF type:complete len:109 (+),score=5.76 TRINITY_DN6699_c0_g1_i3:40-366(+)
MSIPPPDSERGELIFKSRCAVCHTLGKGESNKTGPNLYGLFGRTAGTASGYRYSPASKQSGIVWEEQTLYEFLKNPKEYIPKTKMGFTGLKNAQDRADVIGYLKIATS